MNRLLSLKVAAERLACSEAALRKWIFQGRIPKVNVGRLVRVRESDIELLILRGLPYTRYRVPRDP
jgi:excisionase family DNA binding protein